MKTVQYLKIQGGLKEVGDFAMAIHHAFHLGDGNPQLKLFVTQIDNKRWMIQVFNKEQYDRAIKTQAQPAFSCMDITKQYCNTYKERKTAIETIEMMCVDNCDWDAYDEYLKYYFSIN